MGNTADRLLDNLKVCANEFDRICQEEFEKHQRYTPHSFVSPTAHFMFNNIYSDSSSEYTSSEESSEDDKYTIYVLQLAEGKYYVGKTKDLNKRYEEHLLGSGSKWTAKYPVINMFKYYENKNSYDEDKYTKRFMNKFGIDNVRGGSYCQVVLTAEVKSLINNEICGSEDRCYKCKQTGHYANKCNNSIPQSLPR